MDIDQQRKLYDIIFQTGIMIHTHPDFKGKTTEEVAEWIASQLNQCGFYNVPVGSCWGVPVSEQFYRDYLKRKDDERNGTEG